MLPEKIIALEVDFFHISQTFSAEEINKFIQILYEMSIYNNLFLFTNDSYSFVLQFLQAWNLPMGYIVFNSGACIYHLASKKKIFEKFLSKNAVVKIVRFCFFRQLSVILHTSNNLSFTFGINYLDISKYRGLAFKYKLLMFRYISLKTWGEIKEVLDNYSIYSIELLFNESADKSIERKMEIITKFLTHFDFKFKVFIVDSKIYFFSEENSKLEVIKKITSMSLDEIKRNLIYFSLSFPDSKLALNSYFWFSDTNFSEWINKKSEFNKPIYMPKGNIAWIDWWRENEYIWKDSLMRMDWISKKLKNIDSEKLKQPIIGNNNFYELNLKTGILSRKTLEDKEKRWVIKKDNWKEKLSLSLFLWPDQIDSFLGTEQK
ncbi:hypothetical protein [Mycoplasma parvum]|uniref:Uncharacterized protein n=1 Tax=Mycoplasma parvum str. Indiana TaxID=1403316 RepID=U5NF77_9MOLU|nr:hypothetical protein [Mycoplasma parvum]AGX88848.1 hypothetical protein PRV_00365 [Mycoplasma parvum str. Indiana]